MRGVDCHFDKQNRPAGFNAGIQNGSISTAAERTGRLVTLKTKLEVSEVEETADAYIIGLPSRAASTVLKVIQRLLAEKHSFDFSHLRRFTKWDFLPEALHSRLSTLCGREIGGHGDQEGNRVLSSSCDSSPSIDLFLLVSPIHVISREEILSELTGSNLDGLYSDLSIHEVLVPAFAPTSELQAKRWSSTFWPTIYKRSNPFGPQPSAWLRAESEITPLVGRWMALAEQGGRQAATGGHGENIGAVVIDRSTTSHDSVVVVCGDGRRRGLRYGDACSNGGNAMMHATMRAIGMISRKRRDDTPPSITNEVSCEMSLPTVEDFSDYPLNVFEETHYKQGYVAPTGYLCTNLDLVLTHEPCVMCCMAILHSRFDRVIFAQRMPLTGGLTAEMCAGGNAGPKDGLLNPGLGYGIFWRQELNWKLLAWQWHDSHPESLASIDCNVHA